ncbi:MAG: RIP metalloprotease RseP [Candidatus Delongbacteria bacterium]|nr:RIP metalloprotease RseP [Candidatus Delongbacteria bacterium]
MTLIYFAVVLSVIVFVHELGHFLAARLTGVRVEVFSIGFGKRLFGWHHGDTDYRVSIFPLGGYVRMAGIIDESESLPFSEGVGLTGAAWEFMSKSWWQKIFILAAGGVMNFLLAWFILAVLITSSGVSELDNIPVIGGIYPGKPAALAGLMAGDRVLRLDDTSLNSWDDLRDGIQSRPDEPIILTIERAGAVFTDTLTAVPERILIDGQLQEVGLIGIAPTLVQREAGPIESFILAGGQSFDLLRLSISQLLILIRGEASLGDLGGPIFIAQLSGEAARSGMASFFSFIAIISLHIGFLNLLPLPVLDGGHIVITSLEALIRRPLPLTLKLRIQQVGLVLLLFLMLIALRNDLMRIGLFGAGGN